MGINDLEWDTIHMIEAYLPPLLSPSDHVTRGCRCDGIAGQKLHIFVGKDSVVLNIASRLAPKQATHLIQLQMKSLLS